MGKHALLSASSSHRWLNCPPSARLSEHYADQSSEYAVEGTEAHTLCEYKLKTALGMKTCDPSANLRYYNDEMEDCANGYAAFILELMATARQTCRDPIVLIEQRLDFSRFVRDGFGTGDCVLIADGTLHVVDYKHGQGVLVEAEGNPQMMLYALGALELFEGIYDISTVSMTIYQPRRENVSTYTVFKESLYQWAEDFLRPASEQAYAGEGAFRCGDWCRFCKAKCECRARADENMTLARYDFQKPPLLSDDEVESILARVDELIAWASDIKEYALQAALRGKNWNAWKLVEGRANRRYTDEQAVAEAVIAAGYDPFESTLRGVTAMEKALGKTTFNNLLAPLVEKPHGKPALVPLSDKRPAIATAQNDFMEVEHHG